MVLRIDPFALQGELNNDFPIKCIEKGNHSMKAFFGFFAERHLLANLLTVMVVLLGIASVLRIHRSEYPKVDLGFMVVTTYYPGASPEDVELHVTNRIEDELKSVTGIKKMTSASMENVSVIRVEIDPDAKDQEKVKDDIREAVGRVSDLPEDVTETPRIEEETSTSWPILEIGVTGEHIPYNELREYARLFEKKLKNIPGVAQLKKHGYRDREVRIEVAPDKMMKYRISFPEIIAAIRSRNIRVSGGSLESYISEKNVVTLAQFRRPEEVGDVIIRFAPGGAVVRVKDLARIHDGFEEEQRISRINGHATISFEVLQSDNADIIRTIDAIKELAEYEKSRLPEDSPINFVYTADSSKLVRNKLNIVSSNGIIGLTLVLIVLSLFLNVRSAFWVAMGIPFTLLGTITLLPLFDVELDSITLSCLVFVIGIIVDDAIVICENIFQRREKGDAPLEASINGVHEVYLPVFAAVTTTIFAFLPMFFMKGMVGKFVFVIPLSITLALSISLWEAFCLLPAHLLPGLRPRNTHSSHAYSRSWFRPVQHAFEQFSFSFFTLRYLWVLVALLLLAGSLFYAAQCMNFVLFPTKGAERVYLELELSTGASLQATADKALEIETIFTHFPKGEIESYLSRAGSDRDTEGENRALFIIDLTPYSSRERNADAIVEDIRERVSSLNGIEHITFFIDAGGPPTGKPVEIRVIGTDDSLRTRLADDIISFLTTMPGVKDIDRSDTRGKDEVVLHLDYERLARYGLTVAEIAQYVRIAYDGEVVTNVRYGEDDVEFRVIIEEAYRHNLDYLKRLRIANARGEFIALEEVASLRMGPGPSVFHHFDGERVIRITADVLQEQMTPLQVMNRVLAQFYERDEYPGIRVDIGGEAEESRRAMIDLYMTFGVASLGIYFLLALLFNSLAQPLLVILSIPFGLCGVILAFALHGESFSFIGLMGVIGMAGVVVNDALVLVNHLNETIFQHTERALPDQETLKRLVASGSAARLRPILLTSFTTIAGLLPLAYGFGGQDVYMSPMALALTYGVLFATPITLLLLPSLYMIGHDIRRLVFSNTSPPSQD